MEIIYDGAAVRVVSGADPLAINTAITRIVYGAGADFADLQTAFAWLSRRRITSTGQVTLQLAAGQFTSSAAIGMSHPDLGRVRIIGANMTGALPGDADFAVTGSSPAARAADALTNLTMLRARFATELRFTGGAGISLVGPLGLLDQVLIAGDGSTAPSSTGGRGLQIANSSISMGRVAVIGFGGAGILVRSSIVAISNRIYVVACAEGLVSAAGGAVDFSANLYAYGNGGAGVRATSGSLVDGTLANGIISRGNGGIGLTAADAGVVNAGAGSIIRQNGGVGVDVRRSTINLGTPTISNNGSWGIANGHSMVQILSGVFASNVNGDSVVTDSGNTALQSCTGLGTLSPAANTLGNRNGYNGVY
ncbi:hypothetical protein E8M01_16240 [Phreatobacter stygius]|uniref:Right-handed parallel beta-helix repeat-containing protein n=1 Tax=Phreatobacter stygius TaxID=1940610 RepID=A0A4D7B5B4_9HYPH|nr:hypothetical protein E8M01_16240 [Phreatobacter stygius]